MSIEAVFAIVEKHFGVVGVLNPIRPHGVALIRCRQLSQPLHDPLGSHLKVRDKGISQYTHRPGCCS